MKKPLISIVIPTHNGGKTIKRLLLSITRCSLAKDIEIVILDSQSTDNTLSQIYSAECSNLHIFSINKSQFNHGLTRNYGAKICKSEYVFFFTQDAEIISKDIFIRTLHDFSSTAAKVIFGQQIPFNNTPLIQKFESTIYFDQLNMFVDKEYRVVQNIGNPFIKYNEDNKILWWFSSDVCACYKKSYLLENPFIEIPHGEDILFGKYVIESGKTKVYDSHIQVKHSHNLSYFEYFKREREDMRVILKTLGVKKQSHFLNKFSYVLGKKERRFSDKIGNLIDLLIYYFIKATAILSLSV